MAFLSNHCLVLLSLFILITPLTFSQTPSIYDILKENGLPGGLLPKDVIKSYTLSQNGVLEVLLVRPCFTKFDTNALYETVVRANLTYGRLVGLEGLSQEELFLWFPVKDIIVDDPKSGLIVINIGLAHKQLSWSLFENPPDCKSDFLSKF
ncbi:hypothetical protein LIER_27682 [Lithospermum erythrorhizon]|uniref:Uncharacterized protein n=1 Tax=Lithospermum erythrorhizon TaxID=34254 RepID=A0AAV3RCW1_LITER